MGDLTSDEAQRKVNLKLKTRHLLYGENESLHVCLKCGVCLKECFLGKEKRNITLKEEIGNPTNIVSKYDRFLMCLKSEQLQQLNELEGFDALFETLSIQYKKNEDKWRIITEFKEGLLANLKKNFAQQGKEIYRLSPEAINEARFNLILQLPKELNDRHREMENHAQSVEKLQEVLSKTKRVLKHKIERRLQKLAKTPEVIEHIRVGNSILDAKLDIILSKRLHLWYTRMKGMHYVFRKFKIKP